ncbi:MAG TPA: OmpH family outer membrane protein [Puia sp.]|nr:OmpH family outer membrane protein [Puia sp.]
MKQLATILSVVSLVLCGVLFYLFSHHTEQLKTISKQEEQRNTPNAFRIAYFDMDSLEVHYEEFKDAQAQLKTQENAMNMELSSLDRNNQKRVDVWRQKGNNLTQAEAEQAQQEIAQMQQNFKTRKDALEQAYYRSTEDLKTSIRKKVEDFLRTYNKQRNFSFIFEYDPGSFIYYKDSVYNITSDLVDGLNANYKKKN